MRILAVFLVTSCECESSTSKDILTFYRGSRSTYFFGLDIHRDILTFYRGSRSTYFFVLDIHRNIPVNTQKIVANFARRQSRKIILPDILTE